MSRVRLTDGSARFPLDPRLEKHAFRPAGWNPFFCGYCSNPKPSHNPCGHAVYAIGCETCAVALFSRSNLRYRRRKNFKAMKARGVAAAGRKAR